MHLTVNTGAAGSWNLIWDKYEGFSVPTYRIWRADTTQVFALIDSVQGTSFTYTDLAPPAGGLYYEVEVVKPGGACVATSTAKAATSYNSSRSNQADNGLVIQLQLYTNFFAYPATGMKPLMVQFYDDSDPIVSNWAWDFGDGDSSQLKNPIHLYDTVGVFTVSLSVSSGMSANTHTKTAYITVLPVGVEDYEVSPELVVAPNPYMDETQLRFTLFKASDIRLEVFNVIGERVSLIAEGAYAAGTYVLPFNAANVGRPAGIYLVRMTVGNQVITRRIVQLR
jgi:PKD repeat protein